MSVDSRNSTDGGILQSFASCNISAEIMVVSGIDEISKILNSISISKVLKPLLIILLARSGVCAKCKFLLKTEQRILTV